jgi:MFS superfamily sulfate permease-like transporter
LVYKRIIMSNDFICGTWVGILISTIFCVVIMTIKLNLDNKTLEKHNTTVTNNGDITVYDVPHYYTVFSHKEVLERLDVKKKQMHEKALERLNKKGVE